MSERIPLRCYGPDGWRILDADPLAQMRGTEEDWDAGMARLGWYEFARIGARTTEGDGVEAPLRIVIYHRPVEDADPRFFLEFDGNLADIAEYLYVADLPSLMTLLASWGPVLASTALAHLAAALPADPAQLPAALAGIFRAPGL